MKNDEMTKLTSDMQKKLGKETAGTIADDLGKIITDNSNMNKLLDSKDKEIERLKSANDLLATSNGQLLQQVGMKSDGDESILDKKTKEKEEYKPFNFSSAFDEKGNFKR